MPGNSLSHFWHPRWWAHWIFFGLLRLIALLPVRVQWRSGKLLGTCLYCVMTRRRRIAEINIALCFPELDKKAQQLLVKKTFKSVATGYLETGMAWWYPEPKLNAISTLKGIEYVNHALEEGRGVIFIGAHYSALDIGGMLFYATGLKVDTVYRPHDDPFINKMMCEGRLRYFGELIDRKDMRGMIRSLKANHCLWYAPDQDMGMDQSVFAPFFGVEAATITATGRLAKINNSPVLMTSHYRNEDGTGYTVEIFPPFEGFPSDDDVADATRVNKAIEECVRRHPDQYLWMHRRFKTQADGSRNRLYT